jgi:hypothetical protein
VLSFFSLVQDDRENVESVVHRGLRAESVLEAYSYIGPGTEEAIERYPGNWQLSGGLHCAEQSGAGKRNPAPVLRRLLGNRL